jgi:hypothetical protein
MSDLVELARRYVSLSDQLESVRGEIKLAVLNGEGPRENPTPAERPGLKRSQSNHPNAQAAAQEEARIIELIKSQPGLRSAEIARQTNAKANTTVQRLQRMESRGLIVRLDGKDSGWTASAAPA